MSSPSPKDADLSETAYMSYSLVSNRFGILVHLTLSRTRWSTLKRLFKPMTLLPSTNPWQNEVPNGYTRMANALITLFLVDPRYPVQAMVHSPSEIFRTELPSLDHPYTMYHPDDSLKCTPSTRTILCVGRIKSLVCSCWSIIVSAIP